ncbi:MAG: hypothetical protein ACUZ8O_02615 [Candidatus Anammoxibacter sp.]
MRKTKKKVSKKKAQTRRNVNLAKLPSTIDMHYIKGVDYRSIHVDGAFGGITNKGFLHISLFAERIAIPQQVTYKISPDGLLGDEVIEKRKGKKGVVRQLEIDLMMNEDTARDFRVWLDEKLEGFDERRKLMETLSKNK